MFREYKGLEYTLEVMRALDGRADEVETTEICRLLNQRVQVSPTYLAKILPRMRRAGIVYASDRGYRLTKPLADYSIKDVLTFCDPPDIDDTLYGFCIKIMDALSTVKAVDFYNFSK